jgi:hypothetical protein
MAKITGAHAIIYSTNPEADRTFFRDIVRATSVDLGGGWLIFGLPPSELAVHPSGGGTSHELYLMCDDIEGFVEDMRRHGIACGLVANRGWGLLTELSLPGGGKLGVYEPRHARPKPMKGGAEEKPKRSKKKARARPSPRTRSGSKKAPARPRRGGRNR